MKGQYTDRKTLLPAGMAGNIPFVEVTSVRSPFELQRGGAALSDLIVTIQWPIVRLYAHILRCQIAQSHPCGHPQAHPDLQSARRIDSRILDRLLRFLFPNP